MKALMIVCAFNEGVKLEMVGERISQYQKHRPSQNVLDFMILDDASTDGAAEKICQKYGFIHLRNETRHGVGYCLRRGYQWGLERGYEIFMSMAGNNKDNPEEIERIMNPLATNQADFIQGSRYLPGGDFGNMPAYRLMATRVLHPMLFSFVSGQKITDSTNGFRAIHAKIFKDPRIEMNQAWLDQYELEPYLFCLAIRYGYKVQEVPVSKIYPDKKLGYSKMKPITGWWSILKPLFYLAFKLRK